LVENQQKIADTLAGILLVDAGAGTGKTTTLTARLARIISDNKDKKDILRRIGLLTFTEAAGTNMKIKAAERLGKDPYELGEAAIGTFHSFALEILSRYGSHVFQYLDILDLTLRRNIQVPDKDFGEELFSSFYTDMKNDEKILNLQNYAPDEIAKIFEDALSLGILPGNQFFSYLSGLPYHDFLYPANQPEFGKRDNPVKNEAVSRYKGKLDSNFGRLSPGYWYPEKEDKTIPVEKLKTTLLNRPVDLIEVLSRRYTRYVAHYAREGFLTFNMIMFLTYLLLLRSVETRHALKLPFIMVDEFQDTDAVQMKIVMLLSQGNLCVVGDWKQSIYSFRGASPQNITNFGERLKLFHQEMIEDESSLKSELAWVYKITPENIPMRINFRSDPEIVKISPYAFYLPECRSVLNS